MFGVEMVYVFFSALKLLINILMKCKIRWNFQVHSYPDSTSLGIVKIAYFDARYE